MENKSPQITVLMSVYNGEKYLRDAIDSIINQTFRDFEFIVINDGSTDRTSDILASYKDDRLITIHQNNQGLARSLNRGLAMAKGEYIARMDADDISLPHRLEIQLALMEENNSIGICGTWVKTIGKKGDFWDYPSDPDIVKSSLLFHSVLAHPSVMIRKSSIEKHNLSYDETLPCSQDYDLWVKCSHYFDLSNVPRVLLHYRIHPSKVGTRLNETQEMIANRIRLGQLRELGLSPHDDELALHLKISSYQFQQSKEFIEKCAQWLLKLNDANRVSLRFPAPAFERVLADFWYAICRESTKLGFWTWKTFNKSAFSTNPALNVRMKMELFLACLIKGRLNR